MAISLVQSTSNTGSATTLTLTFSGGTTAGNCVVVCISSEAVTFSGVTLGGTAGNFSQLVTSGTGQSREATIWADPGCAGGQTSIVVTQSAGDNICAYAFEFSGLATSSVLDQSANANSSGATSWSSGTTSATSTASELFVGAMSGNGFSNTFTGPSSPWTNETQLNTGSKAGGVGLMCGYQIVSSTGTATYSGTQASADAYGVVVVTLKPPSTAHTGAPVVLSQAIKAAAYY